MLTHHLVRNNRFAVREYNPAVPQAIVLVHGHNRDGMIAPDYWRQYPGSAHA